MNIALYLKEQVNTILIFFPVFLGIFQLFCASAILWGPARGTVTTVPSQETTNIGIDEFSMGYGAVGFEPGIVAMRSGALPLRHFSPSTQIGPKKYLVAFLYTAKSIAAIW
jgi:hypothetical protein